MVKKSQTRGIKRRSKKTGKKTNKLFRLFNISIDKVFSIPVLIVCPLGTLGTVGTVGPYKIYLQ